MNKGCILKKLSPTLYLFFTAILFSTAQNIAYAAAEVGVVIASQGKVTANSRELSRRSPIYQGDTINTAAASSVSFKFTDGSVVTLAANSSYKINNYAFRSGGAPDAFDAKLIKGGLKTKTGTIGKEAQHTQDAKEAGIPEDKQVKVSSYKVKASVATIGVRGTNYKCVIDENKDAVLVSALEGTVGVDFFDNYVELGYGADASYIEISMDGNYIVDTHDPISDDEFDEEDGGDDEEDDGGDEGDSSADDESSDEGGDSE